MKNKVPDLKNIKIAIVLSRFNTEVTSIMKESALERCKELGFSETDYTLLEVPGAIEIPVVVKKLALTKQYDAIVALGAVIRGETTHYDYVCDQVSYGCQKIAIEEMLPVISGVLTCENKAQALDRLGGKKGNKAKDAIDAVLRMIQVMQESNERVA